MKAAYYEEFQQHLTLKNLGDPALEQDGVVIEVKATGLCRSDWHGWMGHDPDMSLPHVPGHELAGVVQAVGTQIKNWREGDRVTLPFVCECGYCGQCASGNPDRIVIAEHFVGHTGLARHGVRPNQPTSVCEYTVIQ